MPGAGNSGRYKIKGGNRFTMNIVTNQPTDNNTNNNPERPLQFYDSGFNVIPLKPGTKRPKLDSWSEYQTERPPREKVKEWFSEPANIGIITGQVSNLVVVDLDSQDATKWFISQFNTLPPKTLNVSTGRGAHYYFEYPKGADLSKVMPREDVEIIGNGHYVVGAGSTHPSGKTYQSNDVNKIAPMPEQLRGYIKSQGRSNRKTSEANTSKPAKISSEDKLAPVGDVKADPETINDILKHYIFNGPPKTGSNNGRYLTLLITAYNLGLDQSKAIEATAAKYPSLSEKTIRDSARATYKREYGLSVEKMTGLGIDQDAAEDLFVEVVATAGWRGKVRKDEDGYMTAQEFNQRIFKATLALTWLGRSRTTYGKLAGLAGVSKSTLAQKDPSELPELVKIEPDNGNGLRVTNLLPFILRILYIAILTTTTEKENSITKHLSCIGGCSLNVCSLKGVDSQGGESEAKRGPPD